MSPRLAPLISGIGVSLLLQTLAMLIWSRNPLMFPSCCRCPHSVHPGRCGTCAAVITGTAIATLAVAVLMMAGLLLLVEHTRFGRAMRATAENPQVAGLMGIDPNRVIAADLRARRRAGGGGRRHDGQNYGNAGFSMGFFPGIKAFTAAVLYGIGNLRGAMLADYCWVVRIAGTGYLGELRRHLRQQLQDVFAFLMLIAVLVLRPSGLLGERVATRA